jgi:phosphatidylserine decarboxylase
VTLLFVDDNYLNSDDEGDCVDAQEESSPISNPILDVQIPAKPPQLVIHLDSNSPGTPTPGNLPTPTPIVVESTLKASAGFSVPSARFMPKMKLGGKKFPGLLPTPVSPAPASPAIDAQGVPVFSTPVRHKFVRNWSSGSGSASPSSTGSGNESPNVSSMKPQSNLKFKGTNDIVGIVLLEIQSAFDLPRLHNSAFDRFFFRFFFVD